MKGSATSWTEQPALPALPGSGPEPAVRARFRRGLAVLAAAYLLVLGVGALLSAHLPPPASAARGALWALKAGAVLAWPAFFLLLNRRRVLEGDNLRHLWGAANRITLARGLLLGLLAGWLFSPPPAGPRTWLPAALYTAAAAADALDGFWARRTGTRTRLGELLDGELDGVGLLVAMGLAVQYGRLPAAFLAIGLAKPAYAAALGIHRLAGGRTQELPPSYLRRRLAGFQMGLAAVLLWPVARPPATTLAQALLGLPFLAGFLRDALVATGRLDPGQAAYRRWQARLGRLASAWAPPLLRAGAGLTAALRLAAGLAAGLRGLDPLAPWRAAALLLPAGSAGPAAAAAAAAIPAVLQPAALAILAVGAPRQAAPAAALLILLLEALRAFLGPWDALGAAALTSALLLLLLHRSSARLSPEPPAKAPTGPPSQAPPG